MNKRQRLNELLADELPALRATQLGKLAARVVLEVYERAGGDPGALVEIIQLSAQLRVSAAIDAENPPGPDRLYRAVAERVIRKAIEDFTSELLES